MTLLFTLLILFQIKHFVADFPLQNTYMLGKMKATEWVKPLAAHAFVHGVFTLWIALIYTNIYVALTLALLDSVIHFFVDRLKASPSIGGRFNPTQPQFWWCLGADQMAHHLTHYLIIYIIITN